MNDIKLNLTINGCSFEAAGTPLDVDQAFTKWAALIPGQRAHPAQVEEASDGVSAQTSSATEITTKKPATKKRRKNSKVESADGIQQPSFTVESFTNLLGSKDQELVAKASDLIKTEKDGNKKVAVILYLADKPLTRSQIGTAIGAMSRTDPLAATPRTLSDVLAAHFGSHYKLWIEGERGRGKDPTYALTDQAKKLIKNELSLNE